VLPRDVVLADQGFTIGESVAIIVLYVDIYIALFTV